MNMNDILKILCGFAVIYALIKLVLPSDKFKSHVETVIGIALAISLFAPVKVAIKQSDVISSLLPEGVTITDEDGAFKRNKYSASAAKGYIESLLQEQYPEMTFTVRIPPQTGTERIYIVAEGSITECEKEEIKSVIAEKTGISKEYVNVEGSG